MKNLFTKITTQIAAASLWTSMVVTEAVAQSDDWAREPSEALDRIANGLLLIGGGVLVVACGVVGIRYAISQRLQMDNLQAIFFGGLLIFFGGGALKGILAVT